MRQRVMIAMALALEPQVVIMDEPTTALDVVMQRAYPARSCGCASGSGFSVLFITHDLSLLLEFSDRIAIMYGGQIVEEGTRRSDLPHARQHDTRGACWPASPASPACEAASSGAAR